MIQIHITIQPGWILFVIIYIHHMCQPSRLRRNNRPSLYLLFLLLSFPFFHIICINGVKRGGLCCKYCCQYYIQSAVFCVGLLLSAPFLYSKSVLCTFLPVVIFSLSFSYCTTESARTASMWLCLD